MDMSSGNSDASSGGAVDTIMIPYLHFGFGDILFFKSWHPSSNGAIVGACVALVAFAILERWVSGIRGRLEGHWKQRTLVIMANRTGNPQVTNSEAVSLAKNAKDVDDVVEGEVNSLSSKSAGQPLSGRTPRVIPPFVASHDIPRGFAYGLQALLSYLLMLVVMNFQAAYFISIILGLGIGEMLFGRMGSTHIH